MRSKAALVSLSLVVVACGSTQQGSAPDAATSDSPDAAAPADAPDPVALTEVALPQAVDGAMWANRVVYAELPLRIEVTGDAATVTVTVDDTAPVSAVDEDGDRTWTANLQITSLADGFHSLAATATGYEGETVSAAASLGIGTTGVQLTSFGDHGGAATPRIHWHDGHVWLTWCDRREGNRKAWLQRIDGGGRLQGHPVLLVDSEAETLYARTAFGESSIGILYQEPGGPYETYFTVVDFAGHERLAPIALDPMDWYGSFGGGVSFDGDAFVAAWRVNNGSGKSEVRWLRVVESGLEVTGPKAVAASGDDDPIGGFEPISFITVDAIGNRSMIGFVRKRYDSALEMSIPKSQVVLVDKTGTVLSADYAGIEADWTFHHECRVFAVGDRFLPIWSAQDLTSSEQNIPTSFYATQADETGALDPDRGKGETVVAAPDHRVEMSFVEHPDEFGVLAWLDERSYAADISSGRIELYVAPVDEELQAETEVVFPHARFIEGTAQLGQVAAGSNTLLIWLDERHGNGITDPKPEVWFETAWF